MIADPRLACLSATAGNDDGTALQRIVDLTRESDSLLPFMNKKGQEDFLLQMSAACAAVDLCEALRSNQMEEATSDKLLEMIKAVVLLGSYDSLSKQIRSRVSSLVGNHIKKKLVQVNDFLVKLEWDTDEDLVFFFKGSAGNPALTALARLDTDEFKAIQEAADFVSGVVELSSAGTDFFEGVDTITTVPTLPLAISLLAALTVAIKPCADLQSNFPAWFPKLSVDTLIEGSGGEEVGLAKTAEPLAAIQLGRQAIDEAKRVQQRPGFKKRLEAQTTTSVSATAPTGPLSWFSYPTMVMAIAEMQQFLADCVQQFEVWPKLFFECRDKGFEIIAKVTARLGPIEAATVLGTVNFKAEAAELADGATTVSLTRISNIARAVVEEMRKLQQDKGIDTSSPAWADIPESQHIHTILTRLADTVGILAAIEALGVEAEEGEKRATAKAAHSAIVEKSLGVPIFLLEQLQAAGGD